MKSLVLSVFATTALLSSAVSGFASDNPLPGDHGRPNNGVITAQPVRQSPVSQAPNPRSTVRAIPIDLALRAAQAIAEACKQYPLGVAVVNAEGAPTLIYIPDGSHSAYAYMALRKAYTAVVFKVPTSQLVVKAQQDPEFAAKIKADTNLVAFQGGLALKAGDDIIGAIGVSGAEPGGHDEECALVGMEKIKSQLK